jgi:hypothetical protein
MKHYAENVAGGYYQAPYYGDTSGTQYEPSGGTTPFDGSNLPDYVTFCLDCHQDEQYDPDNDRTVKAIDWSSERHGLYHANDPICEPSYEGTVLPPYVETPMSNYVLSCLDCHEPHGARKRKHLIRRMINGGEVADESGIPQAYWTEICEKCHVVTHPEGDCGTCHGPDETNGFHGGTHDATGPCQGEPMF